MSKYSNMYCVKCKGRTANNKPNLKSAKNGRLMLIGKCNKCGTQKTQFISKADAATAQKGGFIGAILGPLLGSLAGMVLPKLLGSKD